MFGRLPGRPNLMTISTKAACARVFGDEAYVPMFRFVADQHLPEITAPYDPPRPPGEYGSAFSP